MSVISLACSMDLLKVVLHAQMARSQNCCKALTNRSTRFHEDATPKLGCDVFAPKMISQKENWYG